MKEPRICPGCQQRFQPGPREKNPRKWCSEKCRRWAALHPGEVRPLKRECPRCGVDISASPGQAKFCSRRCQLIQSGRAREEDLPERRCALSECGKTFQPLMTKQRCCSEKHGKLLYNRESRADGRQKNPEWSDRRRDHYHRRRALKKATSSGEPVLLAEIAERDRWRCHYCKKPVNKKLKWPHVLSASLDHVVPLSKGGAHDPANVRLAHVRCNSARGNQGGGEQLLLIG